MKITPHSNRLFLFLFLSLFLIFPLKISGINSGLVNDTQKWNAQWIWLNEDGPADSWVAFRKEFDVKRKPGICIAHIAAETKYWLWINGKLVVFEGQLKRDRMHKTYFDAVDLAPFLKKGKNTIAVLVTYWGKDGFSHHDAGQGGFLFDATLDQKSLISDESWKVCKLQGYEKSIDGGQPNFRLSERNVRFNAAVNDAEGWQLPQFNDSDWSAATPKGTPPANPWNEMIPRPFPQWFDSGLMKYQSTKVISKNEKESIIEAKLPYDARVSAYMKIKASAGKRINIQPDQYDGWYAFGDGPAIRAEYITREGIQEFETLVWMSGNTIQYTLPEGIEVISLRYRELGYPASFTGDFKASDPFYTKLWSMARRTLYINMFDNFMDCPDRERALWWGDVVNQSGEVFYTLDTTAHALIKKSIYTLVDWQRPDNTLFSPTSTKWNAELPQQMLASIGWYGFWNYFMNTNDSATIKDVYPAVSKYLSIWEMGENGLVIHRKGAWDWGDWGTNIDIDILDNTWYYLALKAAIPMAVMSGNPMDTIEYHSRMKSIEKHFNEVFWHEDEMHFRSAALKTPDDRANAMAVVAGLAQPRQYQGIRRVLINQEFASPYLEKYVLEALCTMGSDTLSLQRMKRRYSNMVNHPDYNTLWEVWKGLKEGTINHGWNAPNTVLSQNIAGISPVAPGWSAFQVLPMLGGLREVAQTVPTVKGEIKVKHILSDSEFITTLESPRGTTTVVGIPAKYNPESISANGKIIWKDGASVKSTKGIAFISADKDYVQFSFPSGKWIIRAK